MPGTFELYVSAPWKSMLTRLSERNTAIFAKLHERKKPLFLLNIQYIDRLKELAEILDGMSPNQAEKASLNDTAAVSSFVQLIFNLNGNTVGTRNEKKTLQKLLSGTLWAFNPEVTSSETLENYSRLANWFNEVVRLQQELIKMLEVLPSATRLLLLNDEKPTFIVGFSSLFNHFYKKLDDLEQADKLQSVLSLCAVLRSTLYQEHGNLVNNAFSSLIQIGKAKAPGAARNIRKAVKYVSHAPDWITQPLAVKHLFELESIHPELRKSIQPFYETLNVDGFRIIQLLQHFGQETTPQIAHLFIKTPLEKFPKHFWIMADQVLLRLESTPSENVTALLHACQTNIESVDSEAFTELFMLYYSLHCQLYLMFENPSVTPSEFDAVYEQLHIAREAIKLIQKNLDANIHHEAHKLIKAYLQALFSESTQSEQDAIYEDIKQFHRWYDQLPEEGELESGHFETLSKELVTLKYAPEKYPNKVQVYKDFTQVIKARSSHTQYFSTYLLSATRNPYNPLYVLDDALALLRNCPTVEMTISFVKQGEFLKYAKNVNKYAQYPLPIHGVYTQIEPLQAAIRPSFARVLADYANNLLLPKLSTLIDQSKHNTYRITLLRLFKVLSHQMKLHEGDKSFAYLARDLRYAITACLQYALPADLQTLLLGFQALLKRFDDEMRPKWFDIDIGFDFTAYQTPVESLEEQIDSIVYQIKSTEKYNKETSKRHFTPKLAALEKLILKLDDKKQKDVQRSLYRHETNNPFLLQAVILQYNYFQLLSDLLTSLYQESTWRSIQDALVKVLSNTDQYTLASTLSSLLSVERILDIMLTFSEKETLPANDTISCIIKALRTELSEPLALLLRNHKQREHLARRARPYPVQVIISTSLISLGDLPEFLFESIMQSQAAQNTLRDISNSLVYYATSSVLTSVVPYGGAISFLGSLVFQSTVTNTIQKQMTRRFGTVNWYFDKEKKSGYESLRAAFSFACQLESSWSDVEVTAKNVIGAEALLMLWLQLNVLTNNVDIDHEGILVLLQILYHDTQADLMMLTKLALFIAPLLDKKSSLAVELLDRFQNGNVRKIQQREPYDGLQAALAMVVLKFILESGMEQDAYDMVSKQIPDLVTFAQQDSLSALQMTARAQGLLKSVEAYSHDTRNRITNETLNFVRTKSLYIQRKINAVGKSKRENFFHGRRNIEVDFIKMFQNPAKTAISSGQEALLLYNIYNAACFTWRLSGRLLFESRDPNIGRIARVLNIFLDEITSPINFSYINMLNGLVLVGLFCVFMAKHALRESSDLIPDWQRGQYFSFTRRMVGTSLFSVKDVILAKTINLLLKHIETLKQIRVTIDSKLALRSTKEELKRIQDELDKVEIENPTEEIAHITGQLRLIIDTLEHSRTKFLDGATKQYPSWITTLEQSRVDLALCQQMVDNLPKAPLLLEYKVDDLHTDVDHSSSASKACHGSADAAIIKPDSDDSAATSSEVAVSPTASPSVVRTPILKAS